MRRLAAWMVLLLLLLTAGWMAAEHVHLPPEVSYAMPASRAAARPDARMTVSWPQGSVNPNTATCKELDTLYGVGTSIARNIVYERITDGAYLFPEDLLAVSGIGPKKLEKIWEQLCFPPVNQ